MGKKSCDKNLIQLSTGECAGEEGKKEDPLRFSRADFTASDSWRAADGHEALFLYLFAIILMTMAKKSYQTFFFFPLCASLFLPSMHKREK